MLSSVQSFYNLFDYYNFMDDAIDGLTYEQVVMTKSIYKDGEILIPKGMKFETVYFTFYSPGKFQFINWKDGDKPGYKVPNKNSFTILQKDLSPFLFWSLNELPHPKGKKLLRAYDRAIKRNKIVVVK